MSVRRVKGPACTIGLALVSLPEDRANRLRLALATDHETIPHASIATVLSGWLTEAPVAGRDRIGANAVGRHRNGQCACPAS